MKELSKHDSTLGVDPAGRSVLHALVCEHLPTHVPGCTLDEMLCGVPWCMCLQGPGAVHPANVLQTPLPNAKGFRVYCMYGVGTPTERGYHYLKTRKQGPGGTVHIEWSINNVADDPKSGLVSTFLVITGWRHCHGQVNCRTSMHTLPASAFPSPFIYHRQDFLVPQLQHSKPTLCQHDCKTLVLGAE